MTDPFHIRTLNVVAILLTVVAMGFLLYPIVALLAAMGGAR